MFLTVPFIALWARSGEVLILPKQECLSHMLTLGERSGF